MRKILAALLIAAPLASADTVVLKSGRRLSGVLVEQNARTVTLEMGPGRVALSMSQVERILSGSSPLAEYQARAGRVGGGDAAGWVDLGLWARGANLETQAREAFDRALMIDPSNPDAHRALGHVLTATGWTTVEESYRSRGLVQFEGEWMTPADRLALVRQRSEDERADAARRAADVRVREAEERAAAAEAEARAARAEADSASEGFPYGWVYGSGGGCGWNCGGSGGGGHHPRPPRPDRPVATPQNPAPTRRRPRGPQNPTSYPRAPHVGRSVIDFRLIFA